MNPAVLDRLATLSSPARQLLLAQDRPAEPPIRAELFGIQRFEEHGCSLAQAQVIQTDTRSPSSAPFFPRVEENLAALRTAYDYIALTSRSGHYTTPAAEWLLDNFPLIEAQLQQIREGVPRRFYASLPKLDVPPLRGLPRVYGIAWAYVAHTDSVLNAQLFTAFLNAYQTCSELRLCELWALPTTLRVVLLENLRRMAEDIARSKMAREVAHAVWDNALALSDANLDSIAGLMHERGVMRSYQTQLWQRMPTERFGEPSSVVRWIEKNCPNGHALMLESQNAQVASNLTVGNIVTTLRAIGQLDWVKLIEPVSPSLQVLQELPSFARESESTRQQITRAMERLALDSRKTEHAVARAVVTAAQAASDAPGADAAEKTAGFYLMNDGRAGLEAMLGMPAQRARRRLNWRRWRLSLYLGLIGLATLATLAMVLQAVPPTDWRSWQGLVALSLLVWPAFEAASAFVNRLISESLKVQSLPRLLFADGIPPEHRVLVVIPTLLTSVQGNAELVSQLELHWLANREHEAQFALLSDWADAPGATSPTDAGLLDDALARLAALNADYPAPAGSPPHFLLIHRPRSWCETQQRWLGWERKRGKLEQLLRLLATGSMDGFLPLAEPLRLASGIRYLVTLDSDTGLPPGALRELVAIAAHPLNAPRVDVQARRVVSGHGILQPRVVTPLPGREQNTSYHRMFAGQCGIDPYSSGVSDVYQDLFGTGSFSGKGLLHVQAVHAVLGNRLPLEAVLSHDLLEGSIARCGFVSDVVLVEDPPHHAGVAASRSHRWTRGDWQLIPLLLHARRYGIDALSAWKMLDNLRRSLVVPASFALLVWVIFTGALPLGAALAVVAAALLAGPLLGALAGLVPTHTGIAWHHFFKDGRAELGTALAAAVWQFSQMAAQSVLLLDAALRSVWRMAVSRRRLLEWTTAAQAQAASRNALFIFVRQQAASSLLCAALVMATPWAAHPWAGTALLMVWGTSPLAAWWASRSRPHGTAHALLAADRRYLVELARDTWRFFERCVGPEDNHLPPDNLQMVPDPMLAHRTSPTNIGLYLLAVCCAREFGWISTDEVIRRLGASLDSIDKLARHDGHLLNWYDTRTLEVLQPAYVSSVDSGNLAGLLLAVAQACTRLAREDEKSSADGGQAQAALRSLAGRCRSLYANMDFKGLYDGERHLFHIGLQVDQHALDISYYDLLASESRLTSYLAIAKGDVPKRHWSALGRPFLSVGRAPGLASWSGSMFEYLMPSLLMHEPADGMLQGMGRSAIAAQRDFGRQQQMPWGVSESAYLIQDHSLAYQYSPFGVPHLALRRTPLADRVVAPYATMLATLFEPAAAVANLQRLEALGARGELGMYEALDFTVSRQPEKQAYSIVQTFMAHHQGMSLVALCNVLCLDAPRRWFAAEPQVAAHDALLHERMPRRITQSASPRQPPEPDGKSSEPVFQSRDIDPSQVGWKPTHLLSNGRYNVALRASGAGVSRWQGRHISRWRDDLLRDGYGSFFYLRQHGRETLGSLTAAPAPLPGWHYQARFMADRVQFDAHGDGLAASISVLVSPEDDTELRTVILHNTGRAERVVELVSCFEAVLADPRADEAHPAFSNLFVQTRWEPQWRALLLKRVPRLHGDAQMAVAHFLAEVDADLLAIGCIADRQAFAGRNHPAGQPALLDQPMDGQGHPVNGLDPVASLRVTVRIAPGGMARLTFATAAADSEDELIARIDKYLQSAHIVRATRMAATLAQVRLRDLTLTPEEHLAVQDLTTALMYSAPRLDARPGLLDQRQLWRFGISGDRPIVLVRIQAASGLPLVHALLRAQPWWTFGGQTVDLVILNSEPGSYLMPLQRDIQALRDRLVHNVQNSFRLGTALASSFHLLRDPETSAAEKAALAGMARVVFTADGRALEVQVAALRAGVWPVQPAGLGAAVRVSAPQRDAQAARLGAGFPAPHTAGQFDPATGDFWFELQGGQVLARPWVNVIANAEFGFQVSETGSGMTWAGNSRMHQLTPWSNDPISDPAFEHWLLQDIDSGQILPLAPSMLAASGSRWRVRHGQGYSMFQGIQAGLEVETTFSADLHAAAKLVQVTVRVKSGARRRLRALGLVEWQMGDARGRRRTLQTWMHPSHPALLAQQQETRDGYGGSTVYLAMAGASRKLQWTCDRGEFFDTLGKLVLPVDLAGRSGVGCDPCACLASEFSLAAGEELAFSFILGHAPDAAAAEQMVARWTPPACQASLIEVKAAWRGLLGKVQVKTPDARFDALMNHWLLYQTVVCRLWSKAGFYQAGGASGFRDQLQDSMALALADPARLRAQIVLSASRQFPEGDVQHWWHAPGGEGVRTHFSDDLLWLPYACIHYLKVTGDAGVLDEEVAFIDGPTIPDGAEDAYFAPQTSDQSASLYEHCARTIDRSLPTGSHGLPLMGTGDWNDGMNRVGHEGRGESVWLGWFLCSVVEGFAPVATARGDDARAVRWLEARKGWVAALHDAGWDGAWFRRAFFDNGAALGSDANAECRIDLIAQAWSVLSGASTPKFTRPAMLALNNQLIDQKAGLLRLLDPPFRDSANNPGYIQAYPPGVRENGGQYSHAGIWAMMAQALSGDAEGAWRSFEMLSPAHRSAHPERGPAYALEPYVMAGDIYSAKPYVGRGGWSWYTGSAAWMYRAGLETLLGLCMQPGRLSLSPRLPGHWPAVELRLQLQGHDITVHWQRDAAGTALVQADRQLAWGEWVRLDTLPEKAVLLVIGNCPTAPI